MAKWRAATEIQHGEEDGTSKVFQAGDEVTGLDADTMKQLWEAGALVKEEEAKPSTPEEKPASTETAKGKAGGKPSSKSGG